MKPFAYLGLIMLPLLAVGGFLLGGWFNFMVPAICFCIHPAMNTLFSGSLPVKTSVDHSRYSRSAYRAMALLYVPVIIAVTAWSLCEVSTAKLSMIEFNGLVLTIGIINGVIGFTLAHEFIHRSAPLERIAGYFLLLVNNYMHYGIEHVWGHHVYACTPKDPHTASLNESLYAYIPRAVRKTYINALEIEQKKSFRNRQDGLLQNKLFLFAMLQLLVTTTVFLAGGPVTLAFYLLQNAIAILLLHIINYLQHYGLRRLQLNDGGFEKMNANHSWDSAYHDRSLFIFQLENHSDHHMHPGRHYEQLTHHQDAPEHPVGYSFMVLLALLPPLWFRMMNERVPQASINT